MCGAHGMARHRRQSPGGGTPRRFFPPKWGTPRPAFPSEQGPPRRPTHKRGPPCRFFPRERAAPPSVCAEWAGVRAALHIFRKKIPPFVDRAGCLCYNEAENSPKRSVFGERMQTDLVRAARFAAVGGIVCISLRLRRRGICRGEASPPPAITSFCMENIPLPRII